MDDTLEEAKQTGRRDRVNHATRRQIKHLKALFLYRRHRPIICFRCLGPIVRNDLYRIESFYDLEGAFEVRTHRSCSEVRHRERLQAQKVQIAFHTKGLIRRATIMSKSTERDEENVKISKADRKARSKKGSTKKGSTKKSSTKKGGKKDAATEARSAARSLATALGELKGYSAKGTKKTVKLLEAGTTPSNDQMVSLRDHLKTEATRLRGEDEGGQASAISNVNRQVRRIERSTRDED